MQLVYTVASIITGFECNLEESRGLSAGENGGTGKEREEGAVGREEAMESKLEM
jgi:hypothetical protein